VDGVARALDQLMGEYGQELPARHAATPSGTLVVRTARPPASAGHQTRGKAKGEIGPQAPDEPALPAQDQTNLSVQAVPGPAAPLVAVQADFLGLDPPAASALELGPFDAVFDRGALVAVAPGDRGRYADVLAGLVRPGGKVLFVGVEHDCKRPEGPPFAVDGDELDRLYGGRFHIHLLERSDERIDHPDEARFKDRDATTFKQTAWMLTRL